MQIQLCEDDGMFHGGIPQIVVLVVTFDDGKTKRIPYPADKSISALYQDLQAIAPQVAQAPQAFIAQEIIPAVVPPSEPTKDKVPNEKRAPSGPAVNLDKANVIEKEDIVTLVKLNPRDTVYNGTVSPLIIGMDYRVLTVMGPTIPTPDGKGIRRVVQGYEIIDDHAPTPERMIVTPDEVVLRSKRLSQIVAKVTAVEEILNCPSCQAPNVLVLEGSEFIGTCEKCETPITIARIISKCQTAKCGQEVSCFDVGGKYQGKCGKCKSLIEVPYNA